jgi:hypothetical protein
MNFIEGRMEAEASGEAWFTFGCQRLALPSAVRALAGPYAGRSVVLGVRPEGLSPATAHAPNGKFSWPHNAFDAKVNVLEPLGDRVDISLSTDGHESLICRADAHQFGKMTAGGIIRVLVDLGKVHLFEPGDNGVNITLTRESSHAAA